MRLDAGLVEGPSHEIIPVLDVDRHYAARLNGCEGVLGIANGSRINRNASVKLNERVSLWQG